MKAPDKIRTATRFALIAGILLLSGACTVVKPWERGQLAEARMAFETDGLETAMNDHVYYSKEGSSSGSAVTGGGCGCN